MKLTEIIERLLTSPNIASHSPIYEKYDKNVQGNTVHERGRVAASICVPFQDFPELPDNKALTGIAIATGGNSNLAKISAREAASSAIFEAVIKLACVGAEPLAATDCLNFGNPEKKEQMGDFILGIDGLKSVCEALNVPIVSGNVSLYNESNGKSIPPSALVSVFGRVENPVSVPQLGFLRPGETIFLVGKRSENLGGSELLNVCRKSDFRIPEIEFKSGERLVGSLQKIAATNKISTAQPILNGGLIIALLKSCFENNFGAEISIPEDIIPGFLFGEDLGVVVSSYDGTAIQEAFGDEAVELGKVKEKFHIQIMAGDNVLLEKNLSLWKDMWGNTLRKIF